MSAFDFNTASEQRDYDVIPDKTVAVVQLKIRDGNAGPGGLLKRSKSGECEGLDCEFTVVEGSYAKRKFFGFYVLSGTTDGHIGRPPFNPRNAVSHFAALLKEYGIARVHGDSFAGNTFRSDFEARAVVYVSCMKPKSDPYELLEAPLNAGEIELPDQPTLIEQATCLVWRGQRIDHEAGGHDDHINAVAGVAHALRGGVFDDVPLVWPQFIPKTSGIAPHLDAEKTGWPTW